MWWLWVHKLLWNSEVVITNRFSLHLATTRDMSSKNVVIARIKELTDIAKKINLDDNQNNRTKSDVNHMNIP